MKRTKSEAEQTRANILAAAMQVFAEKGFDAAKLDEIAGTAGVTRGAIYWHFKDKLDLFIQLLQDAFGQFVQNFDAIFSEPISPIQKIRSILEIVFRNSCNDQTLSRIVMTEFILHAKDPKNGTRILSVVTNFLQELDMKLAALIRQGQEQVEIRTDISPEDILFLIRAFMKAISIHPKIPIQSNFDPLKSGIYSDVLIRGISAE